MSKAVSEKHLGVPVPTGRSNPAWVMYRLVERLRPQERVAVIARKQAVRRIAAQMEQHFPDAGSFDRDRGEYLFLNGAVAVFLHPDQLDDVAADFDRVVVDKSEKNTTYFHLRLLNAGGK